MTQDQKGWTLERLIQTIVATVIIALLGWVAGTTQQTSIAIARLQVEVEFLKQRINEPNSKFTKIESRLDSIERQLMLMQAGPTP